MSTVIFICKTMPSLNVIVRPMGKRDAHGNRLPGLHATFQCGVLKTNNEEVISKIKSLESFKAGSIEISDEKSASEAKKPGVQVSVGGIGADNTKDLKGAPAAKPRRGNGPAKTP